MKNKLPSAAAIVLSNLGGPRHLDDIVPFLFDLFMDRNIIPIPLEGYWRRPLAQFMAWRRSRIVRERYERIGNGSPIVELTQQQAEALRTYLGQETMSWSVSIAMRYGSPSITACLQSLPQGISDLVLIPLFPQYCKATTGTVRTVFEHECARLKIPLKLHCVDHFWDHPVYLQAMEQKIRQTLDPLSTEIRSQTKIIFAAHSVPVSFVRQGDPYVSQIQSTATQLASQLGLEKGEWHIAFQSRLGPIRWVGPDTGEVLDTLAREKTGSIAVVPLSFVSDHLETLYDLDIVMKNTALTLGIHHFHRVECLNSSPLMVQLLAELAHSHFSDSTRS